MNLHSITKDAEHLAAAAKGGLSSAFDSVEHSLDSAKDGANHAASSARSAWVDGLKAVTGLVHAVRSFDSDDALGLIGLRRRRSPLVASALFGAGVAVGLGAGILVAPASGRETRRRIRSGLAAMLADTKSAVTHAAADAKSTVEHAASGGQEAFRHAGAEVKLAVDHAVGDGKEAVKHAATDLKNPGSHAPKA